MLSLSNLVLSMNRLLMLLGIGLLGCKLNIGSLSRKLRIRSLSTFGELHSMADPIVEVVEPLGIPTGQVGADHARESLLVKDQTLGAEKAELQHLGFLIGIDDGIAHMKNATVI